MANKNPDKKWKPGQSGNPNGRPKKGQCLTDVLEATIDKQELANQLNKLVLAGDITAIKYAYDRIDGTAKQTIDNHVFQDDLHPVAEELRELRKAYDKNVK